MTDLFIKQAALAQNTTWQNRVRLAMFKIMSAVQGEAKASMGANQWEKRQQLSVRVLSNPGSYVDRFAWACAVDPTVAAAIGSPLLVASATVATPIVVTTATHGYTTGDTVDIVGHLGNTQANGGWVITVLTTTTFSIPAGGSGTDTANSGTVTKQPPDGSLESAVSSLVDDFAGVQITDL